MRYLTVLLTAVLLSACATKPRVLTFTRYKTLDCPAVNSCDVPRHNIVYNRDLAMAYSDTLHRVGQCRIAVNTLRSCIANSNKIIAEENAKIDGQIKEAGGKVEESTAKE